ncbi:peptidylprolyl isomerase [Sphingobacterium rhinopitheci]|uniref:peptidylprolyl isomerase n=1 Tax=Sphingobacterium rhinopitheci TaxID=2781960 RepID=UPI001F515891|nr:peptidylprolyl isomerase [Sphingobacterium rhinopitheci]MCI0921021.1 peptidylprolyl isomerase [Sphingobacterium rhinopitheci]
MKKILIVVFSLFVLLVSAQKPQHYYVEIKTSKGNILIQLLNETPQHRDNFKKLIEDGFYDSLLFHRVIHNFMIQTGDPNSRNAADDVLLGNGGPDYTIPAEIKKELFHVKGALGAARDNNPEKASSASQFYIVQGRKFSNAGLDSLETLRMKGVKFSDEQRQAYTTIGGTPHLDGNYTVFGKTLSGLEVVDKIAAVPTNAKDRPLVNERMAIRLLTKREAENIERAEKGLKPKKSLFGGGSKSYKLDK